MIELERGKITLKRVDRVDTSYKKPEVKRDKKVYVECPSCKEKKLELKEVPYSVDREKHLRTNFKFYCNSCKVYFKV